MHEGGEVQIVGKGFKQEDGGVMQRNHRAAAPPTPPRESTSGSPRQASP
jgi:hypothetical protein